MARTSRAPRSRTSSASAATPLTWAKNTELVGLVFELEPLRPSALYAQYPIGLHAWFLDQVRQSNPDLSATLHDAQDEKAFTLSGLAGNLGSKGRDFQLQPGERYRWTLTGLSKPVVQWMSQWLKALPQIVELRNAPLQIQQVELLHPPTTYAQLWNQAQTLPSTVTLSFISPTSFRRRGHHFPLPVPFNLFHSYLRRWNSFCKIQVDADEFLDWIDESVIVLRHRLESTKVVAGKKGSVTGFTGAVEFGLSPKAQNDEQLAQLFYALSLLAPYCGTGHKTTFGLGQTRLGWTIPDAPAIPTLQTVLVERIAELTELFTAQRKRTGGDRATNVAETWATILARRELGESLQEIAEDLDMPYETVKTYAKRSRQELRAVQTDHSM